MVVVVLWTTLSSAQLVEEIMVEPDKANDGETENTTNPTENGEEKISGQEAAPKKKTKKTNLEFSISRAVQWMKPEIDAAFEVEGSMSNADRIVQETSDKRNELESYLFDMRDKIYSYGSLLLIVMKRKRKSFPRLLKPLKIGYKRMVSMRVRLFMRRN